MTLTRDGVIAAIVRGRVVRLSLDDEQKRALRDRDGQLAPSIVRHTIAARAASVEPGAPPGEFPLQSLFMQAVARKLGHRVGIKRLYAIRRMLLDAHIIEESGSYRPAYRRAGCGTHRVTVFRLAIRVVGRVRRRSCGTSSLEASSRHRRSVKRPPERRWWAHGLFGTPDGLPPPEMRERSRAAKRMRKWRSADERAAACR